MSVPGLRSGSGHNPHVRMPAVTPPANAHETQYTDASKTNLAKTFKPVRTRGRVMGTPGKIPGDVYAQVIKAKQRGRRNPNVLGDGA